MGFLWYITTFGLIFVFILSLVIFAAAKIIKFLLVEREKREVRRVRRNGTFKSTLLKRAEYDVIIVGAGPAGSSAAAYCARARLRVLLLDRASFPRAKSCAGIIAEPGVKLLKDLGVYQKLEGEGHVKYTNAVSLQSPAGLSHTGSLTRDGQVITIDRNALDEQIIRRATDLGATFMPNSEVLNATLNEELGLWSITVGGQAEEVYKSRMLICADGSQSRLAHKLKLCSEEPAAVASYTPVSSSKVGELLVSYRAETLPGFCVVTPQPDKQSNFVYFLNRGPRKEALGNVQAKDLPSITALALEKNDMKSETITQGKPQTTATESIRSACQGMESTFAAHVLVIGDAAGFLDPLTGMGLHTALMSAKCASETVLEMRREGDFSSRSCGVYEDKWVNAFGYDFALGRAMAKAIYQYPLLLDVWVRLIKLLGNRFLDVWSKVATSTVNKAVLLEPRYILPYGMLLGYSYLKEAVLKKAQ